MSQNVMEHLECYVKIKPLGTKGNLWLVKHSKTEENLVIHRVSIHSKGVYQTLKEIHHPNMIRVVDVFDDEEFLYVVEEYLEWKLLADVIEEDGPMGSRALLVGKQLLEALSVLQKHRIVHRDIKPENIMMDEEGNVKLIDFDISRFYLQDKKHDTTLKGTRDYAPPEQFGFAQSDYRADLFSLGVTLNELATGKLPEEQLCKGRLKKIVRRCTQLDPKHRYQSAKQALRYIAWLEKRTALCVLSGIVLIGLVTAGIFLLSNNRNSANNSESSYREGVPQMGTEEAQSTYTPEQDRIMEISPEAGQAEEYPSILLNDGNEEAEWTYALGDGTETEIALQKQQDKLKLVCARQGEETAEFQFEDIFLDTYRQYGVQQNFDLEEGSPEYEIVANDIDQDGISELFVTFAWRKLIGSMDSEDRYYLVEYSTVWVVYLDQNGIFQCSSPLYFEACAPTFSSQELLLDSLANVWYSFHNGEWKEF